MRRNRITKTLGIIQSSSAKLSFRRAEMQTAKGERETTNKLALVSLPSVGTSFFDTSLSTVLDLVILPTYLPYVSDIV